MTLLALFVDKTETQLTIYFDHVHTWSFWEQFQIELILAVQMRHQLHLMKILYCLVTTSILNQTAKFFINL